MSRKRVWSEDQQRLLTQFEHKWGIHAVKLAELEGVTPDAIHMRVRNYGNPFQRRAKPTVWEQKYGKTIVELAIEIGIHPISVASREREYGDVYREPESGTVGTWNKGRQHPGVTPWQENTKYSKPGQTTFFKLDK